MDLATPINSVIPGVAGVVLQILEHTTQPLTGRRIADLAEGRSSRAGVTKVLKSLVASGLVTCTSAGKANLYELNRDHVAADAISLLANLRDTTLQRIRTHVDNWEVPAVAVWLFGSVARGEGSVESDVDLIVVRPSGGDDECWTKQMMELERSVRVWTGNTCEILDYTGAELRNLAKLGDALIDSLRKDAVLINGKRLEQVIGEGS